MSVKKKLLNGTVWTTTSTITRSLVSLFQISIVTRFVDKEAFGVIAIASVVVGFTQIFMDLGISVGIMHKRDISKDEYSSLFWTNILLGIVLTLLGFALAPLVSQYYNKPELTPIVRWLCLGIFLSSLSIQQKTVQQKYQRFRFIATIEIIASVIACTAATLLAINGAGVYSLIFSTLAMSLVSSVTYLVYGLNKDNFIKFHYRYAETKSFLKIGYFSVGSSILDFLSREMDVLFISKLFSIELLGAYVLCKKVVMMLYSTINPIMTRVLVPIFAEIQNEKERVRNIYSNLIRLLAGVNFPIYTLVGICAYPAILILYGEKYVEYASFLTILSFTYAVITISNPVGILQTAYGRTDIGFYWTIYRIISTFLLFLVLIRASLETILLVLLVNAIVNMIVIWRMQIKKMIGIELKSYLHSFAFPFLISFFFLILMLCLKQLNFGIIFSVVMSLAFIVVYFIFLLWDKYILKTLLEAVKR